MSHVSRKFTLPVFCCGLLMLLSAAIAGAATPVFDIPYLKNVRIDGHADDWGKAGFRVDAMCALDGVVKPVSDFDPHFCVAWNEQGLLLLLQVRDNTVFADTEHDGTWLSDSVEVFMGTAPGSQDFFQTALVTSADPKSPRLRKALFDFRVHKATLPALDAQAADSKTADGYQMEVLLPWANLGITPTLGNEAALQVWVYDVDKMNEWFRAAWYPYGLTYQDTNSAYRVRLARRAGAAQETLAFGQYKTFSRGTVSVVAPGAYAGRAVTVRDGQAIRATGTLALNENGRAMARVQMPIPWTNAEMERYTVWIDDKAQIHQTLFPDPEAYRANKLMFTDLAFQPAVFSGKQFPPCDFSNAQLAEDLLGDYTIDVTFYDGDYHVVTSAEQPGRYGAVVKVTPEHGKPFLRYRTLFRAPDGVDWDAMAENIKVTLPAALEIDAKVAQECAGEVDYAVARRWVDAAYLDSNAAVQLAAMREAKPGQMNADDWYDTNGRAADHRWWLTLKRKLYGNDVAFSTPFVCPAHTEGAAARVVHDGTPAEAGVQPDAAGKIDAVCRQWAEKGGEGCGVCVVRHGVIVLHQAYGMRDGKPMTVNDASGMASVTKLINGTLLMMLIDQRRVQLDDPVAKYLPAFSGIQAKTPLTLRHLYTHTSGYAGLWGEWDNDLDQITAPYAPYLKVGLKMDYTNVGYDLGALVIEQVCGETLTDCYRHHLLDPLACTHTLAHGGAYGTASAPLDMAKIGQLLLNKGAYGEYRFFSEATFQQMTPHPLPGVVAGSLDVRWGIGTLEPQGITGLSKSAFGHTGSTSCFLYVDPENDLVISVTRNDAGKDYETYRQQFIDAVVGGLAK